MSAWPTTRLGEISESIEDALDLELAPSAAENCGRRLAEKMLARGAAAMLGHE